MIVKSIQFGCRPRRRSRLVRKLYMGVLRRANETFDKGMRQNELILYFIFQLIGHAKVPHNKEDNEADKERHLHRTQ